MLGTRSGGVQSARLRDWGKMKVECQEGIMGGGSLIRYHHMYSHHGATTSTSQPLPRLILTQSPLLPRPPTLVGPPNQRSSLFPRDFPKKHRNHHMSTRTNVNLVSQVSRTPGSQAKLLTHADLMAGPSLRPIRNPTDARK